MSSDRTRWGLLALTLASGACSYDWDSLRPTDGGGSADVGTNATDDVPTDDGTGPKQVDDAGVDAGAKDVVTADDGVRAPDAGADAGFDAGVAVDVVTPVDVPTDHGVVDAGTPDTGPRDTGVVDVGTPDTGPPPCTGALCPCAPDALTGWCAIGATCTSGACVAGPVVGALVISEIMNDPMVVDDMVGEWFEVYNTVATPVDLRGMHVHGGTASEMFAVMGTGPLLVAGHGYAVLGINGDTTVNGGVTLLYAYGSAMTLSNSSSTPDTITLLGTDGTTTIDGVTYTNAAGAGWSITPGHSKALRPTMLDATANDTPSAWCGSTTVFGRGDYGTPGAANVCP